MGREAVSENIDALISCGRNLRILAREIVKG
jgi:hypothetical protein